MNLRHYIKDNKENIVVYYVKTEKKDNLYWSNSYNVIDRNSANIPYYDIQWDKPLEQLFANNIFKAYLNHKKLIRKWKNKIK